MASLRRRLATSDHPLSRGARALRLAIRDVSLPTPRVVVKPMLWAYLTGRAVSHFLRRVVIAEPLFKASCARYGRGVHTDIYVHWIQGKGDLIVGDGVKVDGRCTINFAARFVDRPTLEIGDRTSIGHACVFTVGKRITIGRRCLFAAQVWVLDGSGHPTDVVARRAGKPPLPEEIRPVVIGDDVWVGGRSIIMPGVRVGDGSIISGGSVVRRNVPPYTVVAGNPAQVIAHLPRPEPDAASDLPTAATTQDLARR